MRIFMLGILKFFLMVVKVEIVYLGVVDYNVVVLFYIYDWEICIE